jgi:hypothetical protein
LRVINPKANVIYKKTADKSDQSKPFSLWIHKIQLLMHLKNQKTKKWHYKPAMLPFILLPAILQKPAKRHPPISIAEAIRHKSQAEFNKNN